MDENKKRYSFGASFWWAANVIFILSLTFLFGIWKASLFPLAIIRHSTSDRLSFVIGEHQGNTHHRLWVSLPPSATRPAGRRRYVYKGAGMYSSFFSWSHPNTLHIDILALYAERNEINQFLSRQLTNNHHGSNQKRCFSCSVRCRRPPCGSCSSSIRCYWLWAVRLHVVFLYTRDTDCTGLFIQ